jgi:poly(hydroxyalkanoate) depolymerase family esterase
VLPETSFVDRRVDADTITHTIQRALASAGLSPQAGTMTGVADTIQKALSVSGANKRIGARESSAAIDGLTRRIGKTQNGTDHTSSGLEHATPGTFVGRSYTNNAGTRTYKVYVPACYSDALGEAVPLVVMLHGCTQSPDDFAAGTRMNALAEQDGFLVVYPAQAIGANGSKCWNWFRSEDQSRDRGEPSLIAGITREIVSNYRVDERRIFVAGLSAGAAMAVILGATYPELYAAVGAHSGLPYGAAHDMPSAFGAMKGSAPVSGLRNPYAAATAHPPHATHRVPTIVFHGDHDHTVHAGNSGAIVEQATVGRSDEPRLRVSANQDEVSRGRTYSRTVYVDAANLPVVEQWVLHGAGHAWSGGSPNGSFTDKYGPDASAEMIRFFYSQQRPGTT